MRRHRTTARGILFPLLAGLLAGAFLVPASGAEVDEELGRSEADLPAGREDRPLGQLRRPARRPQPRGHRHGEPVARTGRGGRGGTGVVRGVRARRLHALPLRPQRDDVHVHPPEQRPDGEERQSRGLRQGRHLRGSERRSRSRPESRSRGTATPAMRTETRTCTSRCTRAAERTRTPSRTSRARSRPLFAAEAGSPFSLGLRGNLVAAGGGALTIRSSTCATIQAAAGSTSTHATSSSASRRKRSRRPSSATSRVESPRSIRSPVPVLAYTTRGKATPDAIVGAAGALPLSRVSPAR